jgi:uncharacterized membrane protein (UPF0127 family)
MNKKTFRALLGLLAGILVLPAWAQLPTISLNAGIHVIRAEVANTVETRARGLMYREMLGPNQGMLFVFPGNEPVCMWMRNTLIPLSVAFIDESGTVINVEEMLPKTEDSHCALRPARFALEMAKGWFASKGVRSGGKLQGLERAPPPR